MRKLVKLRIFISLLLLTSLACSGQEKQKTSVRPPAVAGSFYPADADQLRTQLAGFFNLVKNEETADNIAAVIVPHAGYVFSGEVAASAYAKLNPNHEYSRIFILGTSHHQLLDGASVYSKGNYKTPLGIMEVDTELAKNLINENKLFTFSTAAHAREHSIEVQLPFLQYRMKKPFKIVPIVIGTQSAATCKKLAEILKPYFNEDNLFVISSDFSHYPTYQGALEADKRTGEAISADSPAAFIEAIQKNSAENIQGLVTSSCGWSSILTLLDLTSETPGIKTEHLKYLNSGDTPYGDKIKVVGYHSFAFYRDREATSSASFSLSERDKIQLLTLARLSIETMMQKNELPTVEASQLSEVLKTSCGAFVTLYKNGELRGCIGRFMATDPLYKVVEQMAVAAAFRDIRFQQLQKYELPHVDIEISVLTPLKKINNIDEFELGKEGIYMVKDNHSGTFLPQVAEETGWNLEEFLGHCARDKAHIGWNGWKDADLYTYKALVFNEKELKLTNQ